MKKEKEGIRGDPWHLNHDGFCHLSHSVVRLSRDHVKAAMTMYLRHQGIITDQQTSSGPAQEYYTPFNYKVQVGPILDNNTLAEVKPV